METDHPTLSIKEWAEADRPREKMLALGAEALTDAELIAILIGSGSPKESAVTLAQKILWAVDNNLNTLAKFTVKELADRFKGIGPAKAVAIRAALELGKRRSATAPAERPLIRDSRDVYQLFYAQLCDLPHEELWIALTNQAGKVIKRCRVSQGGTSETTADLRLILKEAINALASGLILCHNHPSGNTRPSTADGQLTERVRQAAKLMQIRLLDHLILTDGHYYSYADEGRV